MLESAGLLLNCFHFLPVQKERVSKTSLGRAHR